jgi:hypothetical protein
MKLLSELEIGILKKLANSPLKEIFFLSGSSALAGIYLQHRQGGDLDFFSPGEINLKKLTSFLDKLKKDLTLEIEVLKFHPYLVRVCFKKADEKLKCDFIYDSSLRLKEPVYDKKLGIFIDTLDDLAAAKLFSLLWREATQDFYDLKAMIEQGVSLEKIFEKTCQKYHLRFPFEKITRITQLSQKEGGKNENKNNSNFNNWTN